jgi:5'-nucleotidase
VSRVPFIGFAALLGCAGPAERTVQGRVELVLLHLSDTHSALFPFSDRIGWLDAQRGHGPEGSLQRVGGFARLAGLVARERARSGRVLLLDSGDAFQGSLAFDAFSGEPELRALSALGVQAQALGNHELDRGGENLRERYRELGTFPLLAVNYLGGAGSGVADVVSRFAVLDAEGLRVGVIGVANARSVPELRERPNELGVLAHAAAGAVQGAVDELRPVVDVVVVLTHLGLEADERLVRETSGIDVVLGGHQHLALDEPRVLLDCGGRGEGSIEDAWGRERRCRSRSVPVVHSGAYGKYLGRFALALDDDPERLGASHDPIDAHEVTQAAFELLPIHAGLPEDARVSDMLEAYRPGFGQDAALSDVLGFAPQSVARVGATGADSALGNFAASAARWAAGTEIAVIGASSLRRDLAPGALDADALERSFPFDDALLRLRVTGRALSDAFERAAASAALRECRTQVHVAGALVRFTCPCDAAPCASVFARATETCCDNDGDCAEVQGACSEAGGSTGRCFVQVPPDETVTLATTAFLVDGGGGVFEAATPLERVLVSSDLREAVSEALAESEPCEDASTDCSSGCAAALVARLSERCAAGSGCQAAETACSRARSLCRFVPCLDERSGALRDGRVRFERP